MNFFRKRPRSVFESAGRVKPVAMACVLMVAAGGAAAFEMDTGDSGVRFVWDTTVKYSNGFRLKKANPALIDDPGAANQDDGDRNFRRGLISNRLDVYSEAEVTHRGFGGRVSVAGWYDSVYRRDNDHDSLATNNQNGNEFSRDTSKVMGQKGEILDAFVFGGGRLGDMPASFRLGRHALQWGETLFFGNNGIAGGMAPVDAVKAALIPNSLVREIIRPVGQLSAQIQVVQDVLVGGYYQYKWEKTRIPPAGSYFSGADFFDDGGERFILGPGISIPRGADLEPKDSGQYGLQVKLRDSVRGIDYGLYAIRYHAKALSTSYFNLGVFPSPPFPPDTVGPVGYQLAYAQNIKAFGASASLTSGDYQWAGEVSMRRNAPLNGSSLPIFPGAVGDNDDNPGYAVGKTAHVNLSVIATLPSNALFRTAGLLGEVAWNRTLSVTKNPVLVYPNTTRDGLSMRAVFTPTYNQVIDDIDLDVPIGISYSPKGRSSAVPGFGVNRGGDMSVGLKATYRAVWIAGLNYTHFYGAAANTIDVTGVPTFKQALKDRDFISLSLSTTF